VKETEVLGKQQRAFKTERGGNYRVGTPAPSYIIGIVDGKFVGLEVKSARGKLSDDQEAFAHSLPALAAATMWCARIFSWPLSSSRGRNRVGTLPFIRKL
jgi:hypothetical protein